jgi:general stress protein 26
MNADDPAVVDVMRRSMVARIATLSRNGRLSITPLYFVYLNGHICLGTVDWTLAVRNVKADLRVSVLFEVEQDPSDQRVLRIRGRASVRTDQKSQRSYGLQVAHKYLLTSGGIRNALAYLRQLPLICNYRAQGAENGQSCVIEVTLEQAEFLNDEQLG